MTRRNCIHFGCEYEYHRIKNIEIDMKKQLLGSIEALGEKIDEKVPTPASSHLLIVNKQANQLDK